MIELDVQARRKTAIVADAPYRYLVLGDFGGRQMGPTAVDRDNLDDVLAAGDVTAAGVKIRELEDFHPDRLYQRLDIFRGLRETEPEPPPPARPPPAPRADLEELLRSSSLLEQIAEGGDPFRKYVEELAHAETVPRATEKPNPARSDRMRAALHHPRFQALEAAWRGLDFVVRQVDDESARIHIAQFSREDLAADLSEATDLSATRAFSLLNGREWRAVVGLYSFGADSTSIELLGRMALLAAHAGAPFIAEGSIDMGPHWEELRSIPEAGSIGLALPRFLLRLPYGARTSAIESFEFEEMPGVPPHSAYLWGNPALACLSVLTTGSQELSGLPLHVYQHEGETRFTPCAEVLMTEDQVRALMELGLTPLVSFRDSDRVRVAGLRAINGKALL